MTLQAERTLKEIEKTFPSLPSHRKYELVGYMRCLSDMVEDAVVPAGVTTASVTEGDE